MTKLIVWWIITSSWRLMWHMWWCWTEMPLSVKVRMVNRCHENRCVTNDSHLMIQLGCCIYHTGTMTSFAILHFFRSSSFNQADCWFQHLGCKKYVSQREIILCVLQLCSKGVSLTGESGSVCTRFVIKLEFMPSNTLQNLWILCYDWTMILQYVPLEEFMRQWKL